MQHADHNTQNSICDTLHMQQHASFHHCRSRATRLSSCVAIPCTAADRTANTFKNMSKCLFILQQSDPCITLSMASDTTLHRFPRQELTFGRLHLDRCDRQAHDQQQASVDHAIQHAEVCPWLIRQTCSPRTLIRLPHTNNTQQADFQTS